MALLTGHENSSLSLAWIRKLKFHELRNLFSVVQTNIFGCSISGGLMDSLWQY